MSNMFIKYVCFSNKIKGVGLIKNKKTIIMINSSLRDKDAAIKEILDNLQKNTGTIIVL